MMYIEMDDFRQSMVVAKNEIRKFVRGKRFSLYVLLIVAIFALITLLPYVLGDGLGSSPGGVLSNYVTYVNLLALLAATLFSSIAIVSEFEERTALILFTRPVKKTSIFLGKVMACVLLEMTMLIAYYIGITVVVYATTGSMTSSLLTSLGITLLYVIASSCIAILISSVMKKGSTASILTFVTLLLILPIITMALGSAGIDTWFMLDDAANSICYCIPEYVDLMNDMFLQMQEELNIPMTDFMVSAPDLAKTAVTMIVWSVVSAVLAWVAFIRREF